MVAPAHDRSAHQRRAYGSLGNATLTPVCDAHWSFSLGFAGCGPRVRPCILPCYSDQFHVTLSLPHTLNGGLRRGISQRAPPTPRPGASVCIAGAGSSAPDAADVSVPQEELPDILRPDRAQLRSQRAARKAWIGICVPCRSKARSRASHVRVLSGV